MTFQQLQYLLEVSRAGSISAAAKNLFLAQSSLSASIHNLEEELGFSVFIRTKKGVIPTVRGAEAIEQAARICESYRVMTEAEDREKKQFRISAPAIEPLDEAFADWIETFPQREAVSFSADSFSTTEVVEKMAAFELDVALLLNHKARLLSVETLLQSKNLAWETIATLPVMIQIGRPHPLYEKEAITAEDLEPFLFVDFIHDPLVHNEYLKGVIRLSPHRTVSVRSTHAAHLLVEKGLCFSIGAEAPELLQKHYGFRNVPLQGVEYTLTVVTNPKRQREDAIESYLNFVKKRLAAQKGAQK